MKNSSAFGISGEGSSVSGGDISVESGSKLNVKNNADIKTGTNVDLKGNLEVGANGKISGGNFNLADGSLLTLADGGTISGGTFEVSQSTAGFRSAVRAMAVTSGGNVNFSGGSVTGGTWNFNGEGHLNITGGSVTGGTYNFNDSSSGEFSNGNVNGESTFNLKDQSKFDIESGTFGGSIVLGEDGEGQSDTPNLKIGSGATMSGHLDANKGSTTDVSGTLSGQADVKGNVNVKSGGHFQSSQGSIGQNGTVTVEKGGVIDGGSTTVKSGGKLDVKEGGNVNGNSNLTVESGGNLDVSGTVDATNGKLDLKDGSTTNVQSGGNLTLGSQSKMNGDVTNNGNVKLDGYQGSERSTGTYTQSGNGTLDLENKSNLKLGSSDSVTGGDVSVKGGSTLEVGSGSSVSGTDFTVSGEGSDLKVSEDGSITGGNITASENGSLTVDGGSVTNGTLKAQGGKIDVKNDGTVSGGTIDVTGEGGSLTVEQNGKIENGNITSSDGGSVNVGVNGSISGGSVTAQEGGSINVGQSGTIDGGTVTAQSGGKIDVQSGGSISGGTVNVTGEGSVLDVQQGGTISEGQIHVNEGSSFKNEGTVSGGDIFLGEGAKFDSTGEIDGGSFTFEGKLEGNALIENEVKKEAKYNLGGGNTFEVTGEGNLTINSGETDGDDWLENSTVQLGSAPEEEPSANGGTFNFEGTKNGKNGVLKAYSGNLKVNGKNPDGVTSQALELGEGSVIAKEVNTTIDSELDVETGSNVTLDSTDTWNESGHVVVEGGNLTLDNVTNKSGYLTQTSGDTTVKNSFDMNNENDSFAGGKLTVSEGATLNQSDGKIESGATVDIKKSGTLSMSGGKTSLTGADNWEGTVNVSSNAELDITTGSVDVKKGVLKQSGGTVNVKGVFGLNNADDDISGGEFNIKNATNTPTNLTQSAGKIQKGAKVTLEDNSTLSLTGGETTLDSADDTADNWQGSINLSDSGSLTLDGFTGPKGRLTADGGSLKMTNGSSIQLGANEYINENTKFTLESGNTLGVTTGSEVTFNEGDEWAGDVTLSGGTLNYGLSSNGKLDAQSGSLNTQAESELSIQAGSKIEEAVKANIQGNLTIAGTGLGEGERGTVSLSTGDSVTGNININDYGLLEMGDGVDMAESDQTITFGGSNAQMDLNGQENLDLKAALVGATGKINKNGDGDVNFMGSTGGYHGDFMVNGSGRLDFYDDQGLGGNLTFGEIEGKDITIASDKVMGTTTLDKKATITFETHTDGKDLTLGEVDVSNEGTINANAKSGGLSFSEKVTANNGNVGAFGNSVTFSNGIEASNNSNINIYSASEAALGAVNLNNSMLSVTGAGFNADSVQFAGSSTVNVIDGVLTDNNLGSVTLQESATGNFGIDIAPRNWKSDTFLTGAVTDGGTLHVSDFAFNGKAPIDRHIGLQIFQGSFSEDTLFTATDKEIFTPIGWYGLTSRGGGYYTASLRRYNDQVFRGQVTAVANYQNQMVLNNILFDHIQLINNQYFSDTTANKYAAAYPQFAPYQYNKKDGSLWYKGFGTFEKLDMTRGLDVNNNFYGALVGADFPAVELKHGWTFLPTAYLAYTGAHQTYANMGMTQNGGQGGVMGSFMKDDFIGSVLAFGGGYGNQMDVAGFTDDNGNWYVGAATKAAYNFHPTKHFIIQPNALVGWNMFGRSNWYTGFGDMNMKTGLLNGVNVAPGVNFIYGRETWSIYLTAQYFFNVMSSVNGRAGNVDLPSIGMRHGYLEYGFGATKTWKDRFSAYLQFVVRNVGRTGIGFQGGMMFRL